MIQINQASTLLRRVHLVLRVYRIGLSGVRVYRVYGGLWVYIGVQSLRFSSRCKVLSFGMQGWGGGSKVKLSVCRGRCNI